MFTQTKTSFIFKPSTGLTLVLLSLMVLSCISIETQEIGCGMDCLKCKIDRNICMLCTNHKVIDQNTGNCIDVPQKIERCMYYSTSNPSKCKLCVNGFFGDDCSPCGENCRNCQNQGYCYVCESGFSLMNGVCQEKCEVENCEICQNNTSKCNICIKGKLSLNQYKNMN